MRFNFHITDTAKHFTLICLGVIELDGKVLLVQDNSKEYHGRWTLPGNVCSINEKLTVAAEAGIKDSTNIKAKVDSVVGVYHSYNEDDNAGYAIFVYAMKQPRGELTINSDHALGASWFSYSEIFKMPEASFRFPRVRQMVKDYRKGKRYPTELIHSL